jgi:spore coat polysaccharide biosynthesis protein SpsF
MKTLIVCQARTGSSRLPNKVMMDLCGEPLLLRVVQRLQATRGGYDVVVATTDAGGDQPIRDLCAARRLDCFSGHPTDLLDRHYRAARERGAEVVVKIPSDCPLMDPAVIDRVIGFFLQDPQRYDFVSNLHPATYPDGFDVEVMPFSVLEQTWREARRPMEREHTTPFIWERPERFRLGNVLCEDGQDYSMTHRLTIDYQADYDFIRAVYEELYPADPLFGLQPILDLLGRRPEIYEINARYAGVNWYRHHLDELKTIGADRTAREPDAEE